MHNTCLYVYAVLSLTKELRRTDNPRAHAMGTGPEIWEQTGGRVTHFVSSMGTTGTIMGVSRYLKGMALNPNHNPKNPHPQTAVTAAP